MALIKASRTPFPTAWSGTAVRPQPAVAADSPGAVRAVRAISLLGPVSALAAVALLRDHPGAGALVATAGILLGVPHGGADHLVPFWAAGGRAGWRPVLALLIGYLLTLGLALTAVLAAPRWALAAFLVVSALHFGRGDSVFAAQRAGRSTPSWHDDLLVTAAHGLVVVGLPVAVWPSTSLPLLDQVAPGFSSWAGGWPGLLLALTAGVLSAATLALVARRRWAATAELAALVLLFWLVDPLIAFGAYFALWHGARHVVRLVMLPGPVAGPGVTARTSADLRDGLVRYLRAAALPTAVSVAILAAMWAGRRSTLLSAELSTLIALTAPHLLVVGRLDAVLVRRDRRPASAMQPVPPAPAARPR